MKKNVISGLIAFSIIIITGLVSGLNIPILSDFCFMFHLLPVMVSAQVDEIYFFIFYYSIIWFLLTLIIIHFKTKTS
jgi:hypothetical protein